MYTFPLVRNKQSLHTCKKKNSIALNKHTVGTLQFGFKADRTTDLFVTRIKKNFPKIDKISVLQPVTEKNLFY